MTEPGSHRTRGLWARQSFENPRTGRDTHYRQIGSIPGQAWQNYHSGSPHRAPSGRRHWQNSASAGYFRGSADCRTLRSRPAGCCRQRMPNVMKSSARPRLAFSCRSSRKLSYAIMEPGLRAIRRIRSLSDNMRRNGALISSRTCLAYRRHCGNIVRFQAQRCIPRNPEMTGIWRRPQSRTDPARRIRSGPTKSPCQATTWKTFSWPRISHATAASVRATPCRRQRQRSIRWIRPRPLDSGHAQGLFFVPAVPSSG